MSEYTYEEVIIDSTIEKAKNCIGKEVYVSDNPVCCLKYANENNKLVLKKLIGIAPDMYKPFKVSNGCSYYYVSCIIPKKEKPESEYVPFKNIDEFIEAWMCTQEKPETVNVIDCFGIWLRHIIDDEEQHMVQVVEIWNDGLVLGSDYETTRWEELLEHYQFLNGTPCGKRY